MRQDIFVPKTKEREKNLIGVIFEQKNQAESWTLAVCRSRLTESISVWNLKRRDPINWTFLVLLLSKSQIDAIGFILERVKKRDDERSRVVDEHWRQSIVEDEEKHRWTVSKGKDERLSRIFFFLLPRRTSVDETNRFARDSVDLNSRRWMCFFSSSSLFTRQISDENLSFG